MDFTFIKLENSKKNFYYHLVFFKLYTIIPIYEDLSQDSVLVKSFHGKTLKVEENFNGTIEEQIPNKTFVTLL